MTTRETKPTKGRRGHSPLLQVVVSILSTLYLYPTEVESFLPLPLPQAPSRNGRHLYRGLQQTRQNPPTSLVILHQVETSSTGGGSFDFASPRAWEQFYQEHNTQDDNKDDDFEFVYEWHNSIPLQSLAEWIPNHSQCLMIGCGNSLLPQAVLDHRQNVQMTLLDTSQTCLDQLQQKYEISVDHYICGSATELSKCCPPQVNYDIIVDKGLTDALMCGEGWDFAVEALLRESCQVVNCSKNSHYLLVSYKLMESTKEFLQRTSNQVGASCNLQWDWNFDIEGISTDRVSVSMATIAHTEAS